ncbi:nucleotidyltransferase domain-containing protein [uncultured Thiodictyon sp.]|uniref:nucleotidyltransferase domain-containing protein n=1 Tax=uncultured Thiodictyon sp. TaxID=1846217 RepID=UPI0025E57853|nr:nucleotidyltransferase domain-containing protein [uncultured Thiodictyon sp.]
MLTEPAIREAAQRVAAAAHAPIKVILFGSYARGDADDGSDLDLLLVEQEIPDYPQEYLRVHKTLDHLRIGVDLLLFTEAEFEQQRDWWTTPVYWAAREGKVLYERQ